MRIGHFLHPRRGRFLPPTAIGARVVAELNGVVEFVGNGHSQGVQPAGLHIAWVGEVIVDFEMAIGGRTGRLRKGAAIKGN